MNAAVFKEWVWIQLLPNISPNSVIIMDNESYHSTLFEKPPTSSWRKQDIKDWLINKEAQPCDKLSKMELYQLSKRFAVNQKKGMWLIPWLKKQDTRLYKYLHSIVSKTLSNWLGPRWNVLWQEEQLQAGLPQEFSERIYTQYHA